MNKSESLKRKQKKLRAERLIKEFLEKQKDE